MATGRHGLGRGLSALMKDGTNSHPSQSDGGGILKVRIDIIRKSEWQPRCHFDEDSLHELADSIRDRGVLQPLLVRTVKDGYELIAGERRLRAAMDAGLSEVPVIVIDAGDNDALELALIENIQREDLNVIEEAEGYKLLADKFNLTQEQIAERIGKARASITNLIRLLTLPNKIKQFIANGQLSAGHAKILTGLDIIEEQLLYANKIVNDGLSVRDLEKLVKNIKRVPRKPRASRDDMPAVHLSSLLDKLHAYFGTSVRINSCKTYANGKKGKGSIEIDFYSNEDLDRVLDLLGIAEEIN